MRVVLQRVRSARVEVEGEVVGAIGNGLLVLLGVANGDTEADADYLAAKVAGLRIFHDEQQKMNRSVVDVRGGLLVVSQFTLYGDTRKGKRPSFDAAAPPEKAQTLYNYFTRKCRTLVAVVETGVFQAYMQVYLQNDGPVTIICESSGRPG